MIKGLNLILLDDQIQYIFTFILQEIKSCQFNCELHIVKSIVVEVKHIKTIYDIKD